MLDKMGDESLFKKIVKDFKESLSSLSELHDEFREYDDFYLAKHWNEQRASWRPDPVVNYVAYIVDQKAPQLTNNRPTGLIMPTTQEDEEAAKVFTQVTDVISERVNFDDKIDEVARTGLLLGTGWFKVYWDNSLSGGSKARGTIWKGDVSIDTPDPTNIYPDPQANNVQDCRFIIYAVPKTTQWIKQQFNVKVDPEQSFLTDVYNRPSKDYSKDRVLFYEYWYKDEKGVHVIYAAGGKVLKKIPNVYKHGKYPFVTFLAKKKRKSLWGIGEPKNIMSNQKLLNKFMELMTVNQLLTANPIALIDAQSGIDDKKWTNKPGLKVKAKNATNAVKWLEPPKMSTDTPRLIEKMTEFIERMGGIYDSLTGETPSGVTAATAISLLQEQGSIPIKGIARNLYRSIKDVYELMIELVKENYTETRYIRITGEDGQNEFVEFKASQYAEIPFDVKVTAGSSTPTSKAYIAQLSTDLFDKGVLLPSEYVEMQEGLPNKDRIVQRLREQEGQQQPQEQPTQQSPPDLQTIYEQAPPELQQQIDLMLQQGMNEQDILQALMQMQ